MSFKDLREFIDHLEQKGRLKRITHPVDPAYEMTEISDRTLRAGGPALLFENPIGYNVPVLTNLFGTPERVAIGMGREDVKELREVGKLLAYLKEPEPPKGFKDALEKLPVFKQVLNMPAKRLRKAPCQDIVWQGDEVDLDKIPVMSCWAEDVAPLLTWGLTVTKGPNKKRQNLGIYRQQKIAKNKIIMRWLAHRGGALDLRDWMETNPGKPFPVSVAFGADPATILGAVTPVRIRYQNMPLLVCCVAVKPKWSNPSVTIWKSQQVLKSSWKGTSTRTSVPMKALTAITLATITKKKSITSLPLRTSPCVKTQFITVPILVVRQMSQRY